MIQKNRLQPTISRILSERKSNNEIIFLNYKQNPLVQHCTWLDIWDSIRHLCSIMESIPASIGQETAYTIDCSPVNHRPVVETERPLGGLKPTGWILTANHHTIWTFGTPSGETFHQRVSTYSTLWKTQFFNVSSFMTDLPISLKALDCSVSVCIQTPNADIKRHFSGQKRITILLQHLMSTCVIQDITFPSWSFVPIFLCVDAMNWTAHSQSFSTGFIKFSELTAWNEVMPFPGSPRPAFTRMSHNEEGVTSHFPWSSCQRITWRLSNCSRTLLLRQWCHSSRHSGSFPHRLADSLRYRSRVEVLLAQLCVCACSSGQPPKSLLALTLSTSVTLQGPLETRHQNTDRKEWGTQSKIN